MASIVVNARVADAWIVDAFTDAVFAGNPAAVVWLDEPVDDDVLQQVAREFNLSETAFLTPTADAARFGLRWFTPVREVDLCGHATLASAHVVWSRGNGPAALAFATASGTLAATRAGDLIELDFPAVPASDPTPVPGLEEALRSAFTFVGATTAANPRDRNALVELASEEELRALAPDFAALARLSVPSVIATARCERDGVDFVTRYFAPAFGIDEDPVTGSAHCTAGPYWAGVVSRTRLRARQVSRRGGDLAVTVHGDRVTLGGRAATFLHGRLELASGT